MTLWERRTHPKRARELKILASACATLAAGCAIASLRGLLPVSGMVGAAVSNLVILSGYLLMLHGVAVMSGRHYRAGSIGLVLVMGLIWLLAGTPGMGAIWIYVSALPIAIACGMTAWELSRIDGMKWYESRRIALIVSAGHALFYLGRAFILPWLAALYGNGLVLTASKITMYEGVLYSVIMPMALVRLIREEAHGALMLASQTDYLTGLGNRRWFFEEGERAIRERGAAQPAALLAFDLDHFKTINDRYGHATGDEVLKSFARVVREVVGSENVVARIGGEEFAAVLPGLDGIAAQAIGEAVVQRFAHTTAHRINGVAIHGTVSIGLAQMSSETAALANLLAAADRALYRAKSLGGNRLEVAQDTSGRRPPRDMRVA